MNNQGSASKSATMFSYLLRNSIQLTGIETSEDEVAEDEELPESFLLAKSHWLTT